MSESQNAEALRVYVGSTEITIPLSEHSTDQREIIDVLRDAFVSSLTLQESYSPAIDDDPDARDSAVAGFEVHLLARFISFIVAKCSFAHERTFKFSVCIVLLRDMLNHFSQLYLAGNNIHSLVASYNAKTRQAVLAAYYTAYETLLKAGESIPRITPPRLFADVDKGSASMYAIFGGQGPNKVYFDELQYLFDTYRPFVEPFLATVSQDILRPLAREYASSTFYPLGLDVISWLTGAVARPDISYFITVPISFPLIGLVQFTQFLAAARVSGLSPASFRANFAGASGLSQGVATAAAIASTTDDASFTQSACITVKWLFFAGLRSQQRFPATPLDPAVVQAAIDGEHGTPSPMLTVIGLPVEKLGQHVASANEHLPPDSRIMISLHNCPDVFVVTGRPETLYTFLTRMKPVEGVRFMRFLQISAPFHNTCLEGVAEQVCAGDLKGEEVWKTSELRMAVYNTENGSDLRECMGSLTRSISDQIFMRPLHWIAATDWPALATHAVDFGPGGANGVGSITARNLQRQGRPVRFISLGDRGKGDAEFYSTKDVVLEGARATPSS